MFLSDIKSTMTCIPNVVEPVKVDKHLQTCVISSVYQLVESLLNLEYVT